MAALSRRARRDVNIWPGFVDALATLLMVIIFLLMIFVIAQFFLNDAISGRDEALEALEGQVSELAEMLALERKTTTDLRANVEQLSTELQASVSTQDDMRSNIRALTTRAEASEDQVLSLTSLLESAKQENADKVTEIEELVSQNTEITETLSSRDEIIEEQIRELARVTRDVNALNALKVELEKEISSLAAQVEETEGRLLAEQELSESARAEIALLTQQTEALKQQLAEISRALEISETLNEEQQIQVHNLGERLNAALATKVHELNQYRSEFFGRLREILGDTQGIQIVGDRFVLQSELLFEQGSDALGTGGRDQMKRLAATLKEISAKIPEDIDWVLRVDGHTDTVPIRTARFPSNWELSSARAISMVKFLIDEGLPANRLVAAGFGEYQPISTGTSSADLSLNRRIELKLTER